MTEVKTSDDYIRLAAVCRRQAFVAVDAKVRAELSNIATDYERKASVRPV